MRKTNIELFLLIRLIAPSIHARNPSDNIMTTIQRQTEVEATPETLYSMISIPEKWPQWATFVKQATSDGSNKAHWVYELGGMKVESDTETTEVVPNHIYAFRQINGFLKSGSFRLEISPQQNRSQLKLTMEYEPPYSYLGKLLDKMSIGEKAEKDIDKSLESLRQLSHK